MSGQQGGEWCQEAKGRWRQPGQGMIQGTVRFPKSGTKVLLRSVCMWPLFLPFPSILCQTWAPSSGRWLEPTLLREKHPRVIAIPQFINLLKNTHNPTAGGSSVHVPRGQALGGLIPLQLSVFRESWGSAVWRACSECCCVERCGPGGEGTEAVTQQLPLHVCPMCALTGCSS